MNTLKAISFLIIFLIANKSKAQIFFAASSLSTNVANGTETIEIRFVVKTDSLVLPNSLTYNDIVFFQIEKTDGGLNARMINSINKTDSITSFVFTDMEIGNGTQEYKLLAVDNSNNPIVIGSETVFIQASNPELNCVKLNHLYRMACHNCFDDTEPGIFFPFSGALDRTHVVELDIHSHETGSFFGNPDQAPKGVWFVRHASIPFTSNNDNNCINKNNGNSDQNFNICLENIQQWSIDHPSHDPIIVFVDLKQRGANGNNGPFWRGNHLPTDLDNVFRQFALDMGGLNVVYKPSDLKGGFTQLRFAAESENWPSLGNLRNKFIFVLTGSNDVLNEYLNQLGNNAMAFVAPKVDGENPTYNALISPGMGLWPSNEQHVVFYNLEYNQITTSSVFIPKHGFISRVYEGASYTNPSTYGSAIINNVNNIAIKNIAQSLNPNMNFQLIDINNITVGNTTSTAFIDSKYDHITQHALQTVTAQNLIVLPGTHYNISAGQEVCLVLK